MDLRILLTLICTFVCVSATLPKEKPPSCQERCFSAVDLIANFGCSPETHDVITEDGYFLQMHRIFHCHGAPYVKAKPVVLMLHGVFSCSNDFLVQGNASIGYRLAELGYDVWLGNVRGSTYSRKHKHLDPDIRAFWDFSWHEMGLYDLPAMMDYITDITGQERMGFVGHSQGTTSLFVMCSLMKKYCKRIRVGIAMSPVGYMENVKNKLAITLAKIAGPHSELIGMTREKEVFPHSDAYSALALKTCCISEDLCRKFFTATTLIDTNNMEPNILAQILCYDPTGASQGSFAHYLQLIDSGRFQYYDWGQKRNLEVYGADDPPEYPLENVNCPILMIVSEKDDLSTYTGAKKTCEHIGDNCEVYLVTDETINHTDFLWARQASYEIYDKIIKYLEIYCPVPYLPLSMIYEGSKLDHHSSHLKIGCKSREKEKERPCY